MKGFETNLYLCLVGPPDFLRRMETRLALRSDEQAAFLPRVLSANPGEARALIFTEKPDVLIVDVGLRTAAQDLSWLRQLLQQVRQRFGNQLYIILALSASEKFALGGSLLFKNELTLEPSLLVDNLIIAPPPGIPSVLNLEDQLIDCLNYAAEEISRRRQGRAPLPPLWGDDWAPVICDPESRNVWMRWLPRYALYINENPIIIGPTGSGKTRLAQAMHKLSGREGPFVSITPRDFSSSELVQAELFGAVAGAYTGAVEKWGLVKKADKGTLFIDELQSIDRDLQGKLITFIENKTYRRVGEADSHHADVRFVFATNRSLHDLVADGSLRDDFAYRLERLQIALMPLHNRRLDISAGLCFSMAKILCERRQIRAQLANNDELQPLEGLSLDAYRSLFSSDWPGNLRQLENSVAKLIELADIKHLSLINAECTGGIVGGLLGQTEVSAADVFERAAIDVALSATTARFLSLSDCIFAFIEKARTTALELSGGDVPEAAALISDSPRAMEIFQATRIDD